MSGETSEVRGGEGAAAVIAGAPAAVVYCGRCGLAQTDGDHRACREALLLEPPRYCEHCRRRLIVQVLPTGWTARCSAHGELR